jgi:hypothetical protein
MPAGGLLTAGYTLMQWRRRGVTPAIGATVSVLSGIVSFLGLAGLYLVGSGIAVAVHPRPVPAIGTPAVLTIAAFLTAIVLLAVRRRTRPARRSATAEPRARGRGGSTGLSPGLANCGKRPAHFRGAMLRWPVGLLRGRCRRFATG